MQPHVTVTVCVRDGEHWIDDCLKSLINQDYENLDIIAVDDGSTDSSLERLKKFENNDDESGKSVMILSQSARGLSAARQLAVDNAKGEWVAITDIDVRPEIDWISKLVECALHNSDENVGAVTGRTIFETTPNVVSKLRSVEIQQKYKNRPLKTNLANGPCSMFLKEAVMEVDGFDPSWYHAEDMELSLKLINSGYTIIYNPEAVVKHVPEEGLKLFLAKRRRDSRAHTRIMRNWPKSRRNNTSFDFLGVSGAVLMIIPTFVLYLIGLGLTLHFDPQFSDRSSLLFFAPGVLLNFSYVHFTSFRKLVRTLTNDAGTRKYPMIKLILFNWSLSLWIGLLLGLTDAIRGKNGHRRFFSK